MKKIILLFLSILVIVSLIGCVTPSEPTAELAPTPVITPSSTLEPTVKPTEQPTTEITATPVATITPTAEPTPTATPEPTVKPTVKPTVQPTAKTTAKPTAKPTTAPTAQPTSMPTQKPSTSGTSSKPTVVQRADPTTGISWDGKSAIIYTYLDGTTGTVPKPGATYEQLPGRFNTIIETDASSAYDGTCSKCGKKEGDGTNGTCVQWLMKDVDCPSCGAHVQVRTCHTCGH